MTIPVTQPVRTKAGILVDGDNPASIFVSRAYSMRVRNFAGAEVLYVPSAYDLGQILAGGGGSQNVGFLQPIPGAVPTSLQVKSEQQVSPLDFGSAPTPATINLSTGADQPFAENLFRAVELPNGTFEVDETIFLRLGQTLRGKGWGSTKLDLAGHEVNSTTAIVFGKDSTVTDDPVGPPCQLSDMMLFNGSGVAPQVDTTGVAGWKIANVFFTGSRHRHPRG